MGNVVRHHTRNHRPTLLTLSPATLRRLDERVTAARGAGRKSSRSAEVGRALVEVDGNLQRARHDLRDDLSTIHLAAEALALHMRLPDDLAMLAAIRRAVAAAARRLAVPAAAVTPAASTAPGAGAGGTHPSAGPRRPVTPSPAA